MSYEETFKELEKNIVVVSEDDYWDEDFKAPTSLFIINALGEAIFFRTRDRAKAQGWSDMLHGKGHYKVRPVLKAAVR